MRRASSTHAAMVGASTVSAGIWASSMRERYWPASGMLGGVSTTPKIKLTSLSSGAG